MSRRTGGPRAAAWVAGLVVLAATAMVAWWLGSRSESPEQAAARARPPQGTRITAPVEQRVLTSTVIVRGTVKAAASTAIAVPTSVGSTRVISAAPPPPGTDIAEGDVVVEVSGRPVIALLGDIPSFRTMSEGIAGSDVRQLQRALHRLGLRPDSDGVFGAATATAVSELFVKLGYQPQRSVPEGEVIFVPALPARLERSMPAAGSVIVSDKPDGSFAALTSGSLTVETLVGDNDRQLLRAGMAAEILDETTNTTYPATVTSVADQQTTAPDGSQGYLVAITPRDALPAQLSGAAVRITVASGSTDGPALVVPLAAVTSAVDGTTRVSRLRAGDAAPIDVAVRAGLSADGFVAVVPIDAAQLEAGDAVVIGI